MYYVCSRVVDMEGVMKMKTSLKFLIVICFIAMLTGCGPSCEERGGKLVFSHMQLMLIGKVMMNQPVYKCEITRGEKK